ncbi:MAG: TlyA family rRNA (cytidine-2'-O)-methyltransferase, partial [Chloroflexia bacterium]|nr:TlyA family rRNA (cytidine-2'-O)-methyltransferase [Chloroflexia bacterium]
MSQSRHKVRADELLTQLGHAESRSKAKAMILAGDIRIG